MKKYLDLLEQVLNNGVSKEPVRVREGTTVTGTIGVPNAVFSHDMSEGFPLLTTKKMGLKNIAVELEGFIKGITSKKWYQERGCHIWDEWANPIVVQEFYDKNYWEPYLNDVKKDREEGVVHIDSNQPPSLDSIRKYIQQSVDDLGPVYGRQWRKYNEHYGKWEFKDFIEGGCCPATGEYQQIDNRNGVDEGVDQLKNIVDTLITKPTDRRMYCSAWNPNQMNMMALPPCHLGWGVTVYGNKLNLAWTQRSVDTGLGLPYNIASYALLLTLLAKHSNFQVGNLTGLLIDCHIYNNHIEPLKEQLRRKPYNLPKIEIPDDDFDFWGWDHTQLKLHNYICHPKISMEVTV